MYCMEFSLFRMFLVKSLFFGLMYCMEFSLFRMFLVKSLFNSYYVRVL